MRHIRDISETKRADYRKVTLRVILAGLVLVVHLTACGILPKGILLSVPSGTSSLLRGYVVVSNNSSKNVVLYNSDGDFVRQLYAVDPSSTEVPKGVFQTGDWLYIVLDGQDRVIRLNLLDLDSGAHEFISNSNFTGTLGGFTQLASGAFLAVETSNLEKFTIDGIRDPTGGFPAALQTTGTGLSATASGGFIHCSTGTDVVRAYSSAGAQTATASSGIGGTTDVYDCGVSALSGKVFAVFNGTTDTVRVYNSATLAPVTFSYSNLTLVPNPRTAAFTLTDSLLIADGTNNTIIEISSTGSFIRIFTTVGIATPNFMTVIR